MTTTATGADDMSAATTSPQSPTHHSPPLSPSYPSFPPSSTCNSPSMFGSLSTARSSISARLGTPTSPVLSHGLLSQGFVDSPSDMPGGMSALRAMFKNTPRNLEPIGSDHSLDSFRESSTTPDANELNSRVPILEKHRPTPLDLQSQDSVHVHDAPLTNDSVCSNLSSEYEHLRRAVQQNLLDRPLAHTFESSDDELGPTSTCQPPPDQWSNTIAPASALALLRSSKQVIVADTRPLADFGDLRLPRSAHLAIPSYIYNRMRKSYSDLRSGGTSWSALAPYVNTSSGRQLWDAVNLNEHVDVIVVGGERSESTDTLAYIISRAVPNGAVSVLQGGWEATEDLARSEGMIMGQRCDTPSQRTPVPRVQLPASAPGLPAPAPSQTGGVTLSPLGRNLPALSLHPTAPAPRRPPSKLSLNVNTDNTQPLPTKAFTRSRPRPGGLTIDVGDSNRLAPAPTRGTVSALTPRSNHFNAVDVDCGRRASLAPIATEEPPSPPSIAIQQPLEVSTILPSFLYLGPEIATRADVETLLTMGIRRVLNVAVELDDDENLGLRTSFERYYRIPMKDSVEESGVSEGIREACSILDDARLHSAPIYVHCKAGRSRSVTAVLAYLIHANAWPLKTAYAYVAERRRGISPNIGFVAELIQFEETELGHKGGNKDSPQSQKDNGKPTPLMPRETKQLMRYTRESLPPEWPVDETSDEPDNDAQPEHTPESTTNRRQRQTAADIEVRKNGQWVHGRRAPVDRTTLQPGRRVSKAGLESMVMRPLEPSVPAVLDT